MHSLTDPPPLHRVAGSGLNFIVCNVFIVFKNKLQIYKIHTSNLKVRKYLSFQNFAQNTIFFALKKLFFVINMIMATIQAFGIVKCLTSVEKEKNFYNWVETKRRDFLTRKKTSLNVPRNSNYSSVILFFWILYFYQK